MGFGIIILLYKEPGDEEMELSNTYVTIDLDAIVRNYDRFCQKAGVPVMAVVKADAYGHGAVAVAKALEDRCGFFGVSSVAEALELRNAGISTPVLILGHAHSAHFEKLAEQEIRPAVSTWEDAKALSEAAVALGKTAKLHLAVDTGMHRIGMPATEESADLCKKIAQLPGIVIEGVFSHFAKADEQDLSHAVGQRDAFDGFLKMLEERDVQIPVRHLNNSAGSINFSKYYDMVRLGISLYGLYPSEEVDKEILPLEPAMQWYSRVTYVKPLSKGSAVSYGGTFVAPKDMVVATVAAGYADGYRRSLSNRFYVLIRGRKAPILGRVCMDQFVVDVTDIPGVRANDTVVLMGKDGKEEISAECIGAAANSFNYEQVCDISRRVERVYLRNGKEAERRNYLLYKASLV